MVNIYTYIEEWEKTSLNVVNKGAREGVLKNALKILKKQKDQHLSGYDSAGRELGRYSQATERMSGGRKKAGDLFTLEDTGDFHDAMYVEVHNDKELIIGSFDYKEKLLEDKLKKRIWGFKDDDIIAESTQEGIINELNKIGI